MKNDRKNIELLQDLLKNREMSASDLKTLFGLFNTEKGQAKLMHLLDKSWADHKEDDISGIDSGQILQKINSTIHAKKERSHHKQKIFYQWTTAVAAVLLIALLVTSTFVFDIRVKDGEAIALKEIVAPNGHIRITTLPDGTKVWLSPGSSLIYSGNMNDKEIRDTRLYGQGFFEVAPDQEHPFILRMGDIGLKVTGTSFNASNYRDDTSIEVVLKTGRVELFEGSYTDAISFTKLNPDQMGKYEKGNHGFDVHYVDVQKHISWTEGILMFRDDPMSEVFRQMERWYNVRIIVEDARINDYRYTATIKNESLERILNLIEYTSQLDCEIIKNENLQAKKTTIMIKNRK